AASPAAWSGSKGAGAGRKSRRRQKGLARELAHLSRLAGADGVRPGPPVQALHRRGGATPGRGADAGPRGAAQRRRDLLRPRPPRLLREAHRSEGCGGIAGDALVRARRGEFERPGLDGVVYATRVSNPSPRSNASTFSTASRVIASRVWRVALPRCGVRTTFESDSNGFGTCGSCAKTSSPARIRPETSSTTSASSSTISPRAVLTSTAPSRSAAR